MLAAQHGTAQSAVQGCNIQSCCVALTTAVIRHVQVKQAGATCCTLQVSGCFITICFTVFSVWINVSLSQCLRRRSTGHG